VFSNALFPSPWHPNTSAGSRFWTWAERPTPNVVGADYRNGVALVSQYARRATPSDVLKVIIFAMQDSASRRWLIAEWNERTAI
jgi:hypothetical protein